MTADGEFRALIAAGGSGGHILPAMDIADSLVAQAKAAGFKPVIQFAGVGRPLEAELIDKRGYKRTELRATGITGRGVRGIVEFALKTPFVFASTWKLLSSFQPQVIVGVGGYASFFPVAVGGLRGIPTWIHEAEMEPGLANSVLSLFVKRASTAFAETKLRRVKSEYTGHPVRKEIVEAGRTDPPPGKIRRILVLGGSQGASAVDEVFGNLADYLAKKSFLIRHQARRENIERLKDAYREAGVEASVCSFFSDMKDCYQWCHFVVGRSGAAVVNEISVINRPAVFIPLPSSQGGHQTANARYLVDRGKALIVEQGENFRDRLQAAIERVSSDEVYQHMRNTPFDVRSCEAADKIAAGCLRMSGIFPAK